MPNDADMVCGHERLAALLEGDFYLDREAIRDAVRRRSCFNLIHFASMLKIDVYLRRDIGRWLRDGLV